MVVTLTQNSSINQPHPIAKVWERKQAANSSQAMYITSIKGWDNSEGNTTKYKSNDLNAY